jgi:hypothetical protein
MVDNLILTFGFIEVFFVCGAIYCTLQKSGYRFSEAISIAILLLLTYLSFTFQIAFILGIPKISYLIEMPITIYSIKICITNKECFKKGYLTTKNILHESPFISCILLMGIGYLFLQASVLKPNNIDSLVYNLARVLLFQQEKTIFLQNVNLYHQAIFPVGNDILYHIFLRSYKEYGLALFSWFSYIGIGLAGWSIATQYYSRKVALISVLIILSMPQIIYAATTPKNDLVLGFVVSVILLLSTKLLKDLSVKNIIFVSIALSFGLGAKTTFASFILFYIPFFLFFLVKNHTLKSVFQIFWSHRIVLSFTIIPCLILAQFYLFAWNHIHWGGFSGPRAFVDTVMNHDGISGAMSNAVRYLLESFHFPALIDSYAYTIFSLSVPESIQSLHDKWLFPFISQNGLSPNYEFQVQWEQTEHSWFGPFGFIILVCLPLFTLKGNSITRLTAIVFSLAFMLICFKISWTPMKDRYFAFIFGASTLFAAFMVNRFIHKRYLIKIVTGYSIFSFFFAITFNLTKPLFHFFSPRVDQMFVSSFVDGHNVWSLTQMGKQRFWEHSDISEFLDHIPPSKIGIFQAGHREVFPYLISRPDCHFIPMERRIDDEHSSMTINYPARLNDEFDYVLILENQFSISPNELFINNQSLKTNKELTLVRQIDISNDWENNQRLISLISVG